MSADVAVTLARIWTRLYTVGLPADVRMARCAEIESDLWESLHDPDLPRPQILPRLAAGVVDDVCWRATLVAEETRTVWLGLATGCLLLVAMWEWLARPAISQAILGSTWLFPLAESIHVLGIALFLGLNVMLDLRLLGLTLRGVPASEMLEHTLPWTIPAGLLTLVTGMILFVGDPTRFVNNVFFQIKAAAVLLAVANLIVFHLTVYSRVDEWDDQSRPPTGARVSAAISLTLWAVVLLSSRLIAYNFFGQ